MNDEILDQAIKMADEARVHLQLAKKLEDSGSPSAKWEAEARRELARRLCKIASIALPRTEAA